MPAGSGPFNNFIATGLAVTVCLISGISSNRLPLTVAPFKPTNLSRQIIAPIVQATTQSQSLALLGVGPPPPPFKNAQNSLTYSIFPVTQYSSASFALKNAQTAIAPFLPAQGQGQYTIPSLATAQSSLPLALNNVPTATKPFYNAPTQGQSSLAPLSTRATFNLPLQGNVAVQSPFFGGYNQLASIILPITASAYNPSLTDLSIRQSLLLPSKAKTQLATILSPIAQSFGSSFALQNTSTTQAQPFASTSSQILITNFVINNQNSISLALLPPVVVPVMPLIDYSGHDGKPRKQQHEYSYERYAERKRELEEIIAKAVKSVARALETDDDLIQALDDTPKPLLQSISNVVLEYRKLIQAHDLQRMQDDYEMAIVMMMLQ